MQSCCISGNQVVSFTTYKYVAPSYNAGLLLNGGKEEILSFENSAPLSNCDRMAREGRGNPPFQFFNNRIFAHFFKQQMLENGLSEFMEIDKPLTRAPLGSADKRWGGAILPPPPEISRTTQRSDKRQTALDSPWRELSKACKFFENRCHGAGQTEVKCQILLFFTMAPTEAKQSIIIFFWTVFR